MSRPHPLLLAAGLFSIVPMPGVTDLTPSDARRALSWFWPLGALVGLAAGAVGGLVSALSGAQLLAGVLAIVTGQLLVGAMHLDGLADTIDGLAALGSRKSGRDARHALEVMRRPDIGAMGVAAIFGVLAVQIASLAAAPDARSLFVLVVVSQVAGRLTVVVASRRGVPPARPGGFGALFADTTPLSAVVGHLVAVGLLAAALGWWAAGLMGALGLVIAVLVAVGASLGWTRHLVGVLGGVTGDVFGALIETTASLVMLVGVLFLGA